MRYDRLWQRLARRSLGQVEIDLAAMIEGAEDAGMGRDEILAQMLRDLDNDGPVFGKLLRGLSGGAAATVKAAAGQGEVLGIVAEDAELTKALEMQGIEGSVIDAIERGDAEAAAVAETEVLAEVDHTWVATLVNTCHLCLPLHGATAPLKEWRTRGLSPETIHSEQGWESSCKCKLVPTSKAGGRKELMAPLRRARGEKGSRRTQRLLEQVDLDAALASRDAALKSEAGRATLARLGRSGGNGT